MTLTLKVTLKEFLLMLLVKLLDLEMLIILLRDYLKVMMVLLRLLVTTMLKTSIALNGYTDNLALVIFSLLNTKEKVVLMVKVLGKKSLGLLVMLTSLLLPMMQN